MFVYLVPVVIIAVLLFSAVHIVPEYQRAVVFFLGRFQKVKGPGLILIVPVI